jgi:ferric-dicitrate binding protein FerR (iron transport regulator)
MPAKEPKTADKLAQQMRGEQARQVLEHPIYKEAYAKAEADILAIWTESLPEHAAAREQMWHLHQALKSVKEYLELCMIKGENARKSLLVASTEEKK